MSRFSGFNGNRRTFLARLSQAALAAGSTSLFPAGPARAAEGVKVTEFIWTGAQETVPRKVAARYAQANAGTQVEFVSGTNAAVFPKLKASLDIDPNSPLLNFGFFNMESSERGRTANMWLPLQPSRVPNLKTIRPEFQRSDNVGAILCMDVCGIVYNTEKVKTPPQSWHDLFNPRYKGRVALFDAYWAGNGLLAMARLLGGSEDNVEPAFRLYEDAAGAGQFRALYTSNAQLLQMLTSGEVWMAPYFRGIALPWQKQGAPVGYAIPREGQVAFPEGFQLVRGSSAAQQRVAQDLINQMLAPEAVLDYCTTASVLPLTTNLTLPPGIANDPAISQLAMSKLIHLDFAKIAKYNEKWTSMWNQRVKANLA
ncbi:ABC transporter substrate-binding protein [Burkholderia cepacia]|uniref:ABC transporter substrate-binding protein n=1 Tax=Burkholderia cepacia TaxID=292 RepID=UPI002AB5DF28|nr:extracellular solute-binding protein [Burkholderia cepacia]